MILEAASKKPRCSSVDATNGEVFFVAPRAREDEERDSLEQLLLWKHAGYDTAPSFVTTTSSSTTSSSSSKRESTEQVKHTETDIMITEARKRTVEGAHKAYMECAQLLALTEMINAQEHMILLTCSRPGIAETRGLKLPPGQLIELRRHCFDEAEVIIDAGLTAAKLVIHERRLYANGLQCLQRYWKLLNRSLIMSMKQTQTSGNKQPSATTTSSSSSSYTTNRKYATSSMIDDQLNSANVYHEMMYVDCSYVRYGDSAITAFEDYLVPLVRGPTGPILPLSEINRVCQTLQVEVIHRATGCVLAATTAWNTCGPEMLSLDNNTVRSSHQQSSSASNDSNNYRSGVLNNDINNTSMTALHHHCLRRKHECMSKRILGRLSKGAMDNHDRWIVLPTPSHPTNTIPSSHTLPSRSTLEQWLLGKDGGNVIGGIELSSVERGRLELNIADGFMLRFSLVPIPSIVDAAPADASSAAAASSEPCVVWLEELLARAVLKSRILVLAHWASTAAAAAVTAAAAAAATAAAAAAATANKDKAKAAIVSSSSDGSSDHNRVPLTLAAAISKLRHPLLAHPHRNVGNSGAGHLSGPGSDHSLRQSTASGRILLALLDVLRCGLRTQALVTTLTTLQHTAMNNHVTLGLFTPVDVQFQRTYAQSPPASEQGLQRLPTGESPLPEWSKVPNKQEFWQATTLLSALRDESEIKISFSDFCTVSLRVTSRCGVHITSVVQGMGRIGIDSLFHPISTQLESTVDLESLFHSLLRVTAVARFLAPLRRSLITATATSPHIIVLSLRGIPKQTTLVEGVCEGLLATLVIDEQSVVSASSSSNRNVRVEFAQEAASRYVGSEAGVAASSSGKGGKRKSPAKSKSKDVTVAADAPGVPIWLSEGQMVGFVESLCNAFPLPPSIF